MGQDKARHWLAAIGSLRHRRTLALQLARVVPTCLCAAVVEGFLSARPKKKGPRSWKRKKMRKKRGVGACCNRKSLQHSATSAPPVPRSLAPHHVKFEPNSVVGHNRRFYHKLPYFSVNLNPAMSDFGVVTEGLPVSFLSQLDTRKRSNFFHFFDFRFWLGRENQNPWNRRRGCRGGDVGNPRKRRAPCASK